jgi:2-octaprenylphenol hydroxylase
MSTARPITVLVAGAGAIGLTVAALLATGRCADRVRVRVLEAGTLPRWDPARTDLRVYAVSRASQRILEELRIWQALVAARACPYRRMHVWEGDDPFGAAAVDFDSAELGEPDLGHIVEDGLLRSRLVELIESLPDVEIATGAQIQTIAAAPRAVTATLQSGASAAGAVLVAADGTDSAVRNLLRIPVATRDYEQTALVANVRTAAPHRNTAWQRFLPGGPLAFLPLTDGASSIVWSLPSARAAELRAATDAELAAALEKASGGVLGALELAGGRAAFPLRALHAWRYTQTRVALLGDAAHTVHPLAGQGMNLGLLDAACFAAVFEDAVVRGEDPGDARVLRRYERERKSDNLQMLAALDGLQRLFTLPSSIAPWRAAGLGLVDRAGPLKRLLMIRALGLNSRRKRVDRWPQGGGIPRIGTP